MTTRGWSWKWAVALAAAVTLAGCEHAEAVYPNKDRKGENPTYRAPGEEPKRESIFGEGGLTILGGKKKAEDGGAGGIGVNSLLWRAALDTIAFMPLSSADPFGGVIITDWHTPQESPGERFKLNIYILSRALRADGLKVSAFRQIRGGTGEWVEAPIAIGPDVENAILTRARQLRMASEK